MATPRLFKLKAEVASAPSGPRASVLPFAKVRVDTGVFHLDGLYDYSVPANLAEQIQIGVRVQLPFGGRETEGIIVERFTQPERAGEFKSITKVLSPHPIATLDSLHLFDAVAQRFAGNPWDVVRSAIPPRVAAIDKIFATDLEENKRSVKPKALKTEIVFHALAPFVAPHIQLCNFIVEQIDRGAVLVIAPDENDVDLIIQQLNTLKIESLRLTASMPRDLRYLNFLKSMNSGSKVVVGTRSAVFAPVGDLATIIVYKESSLDHYEVRSPGWNSRDVALIRARQEKLQLILTGFSPSIEVGYQIENRKVKFAASKQSVDVKAFTPSDGSLLPGRIFSSIRAALKSGPVLFLAPRKGYGNAVLCSHCKNISQCECGGRLAISSKGSFPRCVHCGKEDKAWKCAFCHRDKPYLAARGIDRAAEEISRAFPGYPVIVSAGDVIKREVDSKPSLVLATPGSQPLVKNGYSAVVVLDGMRFFAHTDLRSSERARELFLETAALISLKGSVLLVLDDAHPVVPSIARWNIAPVLKRELVDREEVGLPPFSTSAVLIMDQSSAPQIHGGLSKAIDQGRLPASTRMYGPALLQKNRAKIVLQVENEEADSLISGVHELQRRRSISKKELFTLRINPYSL